MGLVSSAVEGKLVALSESFSEHRYKDAEKQTASLASADWGATKDFIRPLKLLAALGLAKSSGR